MVIIFWISDLAKKSEFKKVNFCTLYINSCKICQNWISILEFFTSFLLEIYLQKLMIPVQKCTFLSSDFFALSKICHTIITQKTAKLLKKWTLRSFLDICLFLFWPSNFNRFYKNWCCRYKNKLFWILIFFLCQKFDMLSPSQKFWSCSKNWAHS